MLISKIKAIDTKNSLKAVITVAKTFPVWQKIILDRLQELYKVKFHIFILNFYSHCFFCFEKLNNGFPENKTIAEEFNNKEELKKYKKKVMPFVAYLKVIIELIDFVRIHQ